MRRIDADNLIALAAATLRNEIQPAIPASKRYALAMALRALDVARREIQGEAEAAAWSLLDRLYDDGEGSLQQLSADIRAGKISDETHPTLRDDLEHLLLSELEVKNPRAIQGRNPRALG